LFIDFSYKNLLEPTWPDKKKERNLWTINCVKELFIGDFRLLRIHEAKPKD